MGTGEKYYADGGVYKGKIGSNCAPHGKGVWDLADGRHYEGQCENSCFHGRGVLTLPDGTVQEGWFEKDEYIGPEPQPQE